MRSLFSFCVNCEGPICDATVSLTTSRNDNEAASPIYTKIISKSSTQTLPATYLARHASSITCAHEIHAQPLLAFLQHSPLYRFPLASTSIAIQFLVSYTPCMEPSRCIASWTPCKTHTPLLRAASGSDALSVVAWLSKQHLRHGYCRTTMQSVGKGRTYPQHIYGNAPARVWEGAASCASLCGLRLLH